MYRLFCYEYYSKFDYGDGFGSVLRWFEKWIDFCFFWCCSREYDNVFCWNILGMEGRLERKGNGKEILSEYGKVLVFVLILFVV